MTSPPVAQSPGPPVGTSPPVAPSPTLPVRTLLSAEGLTKSFGKRQAVADVSFELYAGEVFGFLGPNGAGKTTTIRMLVGLARPDRGRVRIGGVCAWPGFAPGGGVRRRGRDHNPRVGGRGGRATTRPPRPTPGGRAGGRNRGGRAPPLPTC